MVNKAGGRGDPEVGAIIRSIRKAKNMTLKDLAEKSGLDQPNLSKLETGQVGFSAESIKRVARALDVHVSQFFISGSLGPVFWVPFIDEPKRPLLASSFQVSDKAFALESKDDALVPLIHPGDIVICDPKIPWSEGRPVVARRGDDLIIRRVRTLVPYKYAYRPMTDEITGEQVEESILEQDSVFQLHGNNNLVPRVEVKRESEWQISGPIIQRITRMLLIPKE
jgi:transcriptional regulator with XRE-family HTH domain